MVASQKSSASLTSTLMGGYLHDFLEELIEFRRDIHRNPELSFQEFQTTEKIAHRLRDAGLRPVYLPGYTGVRVDIGEGPIAAAFRADIDALPVQEQTGLAYSSQTPGVMHACGHDIHLTVMLGVTLLLDAMNKTKPLGATIRVIFQPSEEQQPGGALEVIRAGWLKDVPRAFALHCDPKVDVGKIGTRIGAITSASDTVRIRLDGHGGHTSRPHLTEDLIFAMSQIAVNVPAVLSRRTDVRSGVLVVWGQIEAGVAPNAIPATGFMAGTMRCLDADAWYKAGQMLDEVVEQVAAPYGLSVSLEHERGVPPVVNTEAETTLIENAARAELGEDSVILVEQSMGGEDFSWMLQEVPGTMVRLGTRAQGGETFDLHQGDYNPQEEAIGNGVRVMVAAALRSIALETA
ncbi:amidohydrolase [Rothia sp. ZJ932]|nr:amidohydrolase [Rothia sp. ZJ932]